MSLNEFYPWQLHIINDIDWDTRTINVIIGHIDEKTILTEYIREHEIGLTCNFSNYKDIMRAILNEPEKRLYIIDIPDNTKEEKLCQIYPAIESIKDGYVYDNRYKFKQRFFDCPNIWVFVNTLPDLELSDKWKLWKINDKKELVKVN